MWILLWGKQKNRDQHLASWPGKLKKKDSTFFALYKSLFIPLCKRMMNWKSHLEAYFRVEETLNSTSICDLGFFVGNVVDFSLFNVWADSIKVQ
ncbi:hypothetical protein QQF64_002219 [Cirrhinus molitorella]|uniref:Uncharacterized protein n=1 Tax=Cirrhinus molitorella TaxID=172907 RepID=A0ABR3MPK0_9TELE